MIIFFTPFNGSRSFDRESFFINVKWFQESNKGFLLFTKGSVFKYFYQQRKIIKVYSKYRFNSTFSIIKKRLFELSGKNQTLIITSKFEELD